jgi:hypothetical protein
MQIEKIVLEKSGRTLLEKAEDCFVLAKCEQSLADKDGEIAAIQHENADLHRELAAEHITPREWRDLVRPSARVDNCIAHR